MKLAFTMHSMLTDKEVGVYDFNRTSTSETSYIGPFDNEDEAKVYADGFVEAWHMGYNGNAKPVLIEDKWYAYTSRWTSCD